MLDFGVENMNTVYTIIARWKAKGWISQIRKGKSFIYKKK